MYLDKHSLNILLTHLSQGQQHQNAGIQQHIVYRQAQVTHARDDRDIDDIYIIRELPVEHDAGTYLGNMMVPRTARTLGCNPQPQLLLQHSTVCVVASMPCASRQRISPCITIRDVLDHHQGIRTQPTRRTTRR
jgi:hypothetical protein